MKQIFRLKFAYTETNDSGKVIKKKMECLAQCVNYTDAESLVSVLIDREKFDNVTYEIVKTKTETYSVLVNNLLGSEDKLTNKLAELFFSRDNDSFINIKVKILAQTDSDKDEIAEYIVPASSNSSAIDYVSQYLIDQDNVMPDNFVILESKRDNAELLFLDPSVYESKLSMALDIK